MYFIIQRLIFSKHLEEGEKIFFVAHKHWVAILKPFLQIVIFGVITPWLIYAMFTVPLMFIISSVWTAGAAIKFIYEFIDWYCDAWLVTSHGVIDLEWKGIFEQTSSRIEFPSIEGVSYEIKGFWATILKFGRTQIDKMSTTNPTVLEDANNPKRIELKVLELKNRFEEGKAVTDSDHLKDLLASIVQRHVKKHGWDGIMKNTIEQKIQIENLDVVEKKG